MEKPDLQNMSVLVVDPHDGAAMLFLRMAKQLGFGAGNLAKTVTEATDLLKGNAFSLVIVDYDTDDGDSLSLMSHIRAGYSGWTTTSSIPFVLTTGRPDREIVMAARDAGVDALLLKPVSMKQFEEKILGVMASHLLKK